MYALPQSRPCPAPWDHCPAMSPLRSPKAPPMKILACNSNLPLAQKISEQLEIPLVKTKIKRFRDEECQVEIQENVRGHDIFVLQSTCYPANDNLMELLVTVDALRRGSARMIAAVVPYFGYARQDRKTEGRTPITAKLVANLITVAGADRVLTMDLHAGQIQGFFDIPVDNLLAAPEFVRDIRERYQGMDIRVVSPDVGGIVRAKEIAARLKCGLAIIDKDRPEPGVAKAEHIIGSVEGQVCIMVDDIVDSGGTLCAAAGLLLDHGAQSVAAYVTHGVLSGGAVARIDASPITELVKTDTIPDTDAVRESTKVRSISIAPLMGEAMRRIYNNESVSSLFH